MERHITLPLTEELAQSLHAGDTVYLTGTIYTSRDAGHKRIHKGIHLNVLESKDPQRHVRHVPLGAARENQRRCRDCKKLSHLAAFLRATGASTRGRPLAHTLSQAISNGSGRPVAVFSP